MSRNFKDYEGGLRDIFAQTYGGKPSDWSVELQPVEETQPALAQFKNEALGITLKVRDMGDDAQGNAKFEGDRVGVDERFTMAMPPNWKNIPF